MCRPSPRGVSSNKQFRPLSHSKGNGDAGSRPKRQRPWGWSGLFAACLFFEVQCKHFILFLLSSPQSVSLMSGISENYCDGCETCCVMWVFKVFQESEFPSLSFFPLSPPPEKEKWKNRHPGEHLCAWQARELFTVLHVVCWSKTKEERERGWPWRLSKMGWPLGPWGCGTWTGSFRRSTKETFHLGNSTVYADCVKLTRWSTIQPSCMREGGGGEKETVITKERYLCFGSLTVCAGAKGKKESLVLWIKMSNM